MYSHVQCIVMYSHAWAPAGGGKKWHLPPLEIQKYGALPKDNLTRKKFKNFFFFKLSEETELRAPHLLLLLLIQHYVMVPLLI